MTALAEHNMQLRIGLEVEFHVFEIDDLALDHASAAMPNAPVKTRNIAPGFQFLTEQRFDRVSSVLELLRAPLQAIGLPLQSLELEMGPSQLELTFAPDAPDVQARRMIMLRTAVKEICARAGLHASFMCRPVVENAAASGWHIHQSVLADDGTNLMAPDETGISPTASSWMAGLLKYAEATCLLTTPTVNGYKRYQPFQLAPDRICWGRDNRGAMIRALFDESPEAARIENRVAEPAANPYFVFAAQIHAGLAGINEGLSAPAPVEASYSADVPRLPTDMGTAIQAFEESDFVKSAFGSDFAQYYTTLKRAEWTRYLAALSDWEAREYFDLF